MKKISGLGRGLDSLIPQKANKVPVLGKDNVFYIETHKISPNTKQPRHDFDQKGLEELASSIKKYGILQPILVTKNERETERGMDVEYEVLAGERRLRAAKLAGLPQVPVIIKENFDEGRVKLEVALIENIQRKDLNALEEAEAYAKLVSEFGLTHAEIGERVSKSREVISNTLRLLDLPPDIQKAMRDGRVGRSQGRALLAFKDDPKRQRMMFEQLLLGNFGSGDLEIAGKEFKAIRTGVISAPNPRFLELQENLSKSFGTAVVIRSGANGGSIQIKFSDLEQLNAIVRDFLD